MFTLGTYCIYASVVDPGDILQCYGARVGSSDPAPDHLSTKFFGAYRIDIFFVDNLCLNMYL